MSPNAELRVMQIWRAGAHLLVARDGERFVLIDATGTLIKEYEPSTWAYEDDLGRTHYVVAGDQLRLQTRIEGWRGALRSEDELVLDDLRPVSDPDTRTFVATVLGDAAVVAEEREQAWRRAADARVTAIPGARADHGVDANFDAARDALCGRIYQYADERAAGLLRTLIALAHSGLRGPALDAFVAGCRLACFDTTGAATTATATAAATATTASEPAPLAAPHPLAADVAAHARELDVDGDLQEWVDAREAARCFWAASRALYRAAALLGLPAAPREPAPDS